MGTPVAYLIDGEGKTASELAFGADQVPILMRAAAGISEETNGAEKKTGRAKKSSAKKAAGSRKRAAARK
jgi:hypothetical protein